MTPDEWPQRILRFTDWHQAETIAVDSLLPVLEASGLEQWAFLRKHPAWRLRFRTVVSAASQHLDRSLDALVTTGALTSWTPGIHEPETTAFGGPDAMDAVQHHFHEDSRHVLRHLNRQRSGRPDPLGRREIAVLTLSSALRAAGLDWYEQGDVWARIADQRHGTAEPSTRLKTAAHRLMTLDSRSVDRLSVLADWFTSFDAIGRRLAELDAGGRLVRGLRAVLAHLAIFHFNRLGLSAEDQHTLSTCAKEVIMGTDTADRLRARLVDRLVDAGTIRTARVEEALRTVPRHLFVPRAPLDQAYDDAPVNTKYDNGVPVSCASQPTIVAAMLEQLEAEPGHRVLELGAGTGFNAALLGHLAGDKGHVTTIDVDDDIVDGARAALAAAGIDNVRVVLGDGALGHAADAPYDRVVATVGAHGIPHAWLDQLAPDGRLLAPVRLRGSVSRSIAFERTGTGTWRGVGSEMNTFMPLRRGIADDPRQLVPLTQDGAVTLVTNGDQNADPDALTDVLTHTRTEAWTGVTFRGAESAEWLELWLTCTLPNGLSRMTVTDDAGHRDLLTSPYLSSTATFDGGSLTYLARRPATGKAEDGATLYEFGVIGHGPDAVRLVDRVAAEIRTWDREFRHRDVTFEIQPLAAAVPEARPGRFSFDNSLNRMTIAWQ